MKADEITLLDFVGAANEQKVVPIYQRPYAWSAKDCKRMWQDLLRIATGSSPSHFLGAVVDIEEGVFTSGDIRQVSLIDGQQRVTTFTLLLLALFRVAKKREPLSPIDAERLSKRYFFTDAEEGEDKYRLLLTRRDKSTLKCLMEGNPLPQDHSELLVHNLTYLEHLVEDSSHDLDVLMNAARLLTVVEIKLDRTKDDPQLIFESLNSTGVKLTQADLIRNFLLMDLTYQQQADLYATYWYPMERRFTAAGLEKEFDGFIRDFLTVQTGAIPRTDQVYERFKDYRRSDVAPTEIVDLVALVATFAGYYIEIQTMEDWSTPLGRALRDYRALKLNLSRPLLLRVWADYAGGKVTAEERIDILRLIESFIFRRAVCNLRSNPLDMVFAEVLRAIDENDYFVSLATALVAGQLSARFPDDLEFLDQFISRDAYSGFSHGRYLLARLENLGRKEPVIESSVSIEHVLPQNPKVSKEWQTELGPDWARVHLELVNCVGNLTLTAYNSELGDRSFAEKKAMEGGYCDTPFRLSKSLCQASRWDEKTILARARALGDVALKTWQRPAVPEHRIEAYRELRSERRRLEPGHLTDFPSLHGALLALYEALERRVRDLGDDVISSVWKTRISFSAYRVFLSVVPQKAQLKLYLNCSVEDLEDPRGLARDVSDVGRHAVGSVEVELGQIEDLEYVLSLVAFAYAANTAEEAEGAAVSQQGQSQRD